MTAPERPPFWKTKRLHEMTRGEYEAICDGCARCCLVKLEDEDTGRIHYTDVACKLLDTNSCRCSDYGHRRRRVPDCLKITPRTAKSYAWLPPTCGYRLVAEGRDLYWWHPLVSGDPETVHAAGVSVRGRVAGFEQDFSDDELGHHLVLWPARLPPGAKARVRQPAKPESRSSSRPTPLAGRRRAAIVQGK
jgi:uncharacterized cysteine cluster protein YcgN (CxxCxxCC family)